MSSSNRRLSEPGALLSSKRSSIGLKEGAAGIKRRWSKPNAEPRPSLVAKKLPILHLSRQKGLSKETERALEPLLYRVPSSSLLSSVLHNESPRAAMPPPLPSPPTTGAKIAVGNHMLTLGNLVGKGGYSSVYAVRDMYSDRQFALKMVDLRGVDNEEVAGNLLQEVKLLESLLGVEHIVQLLACDVTKVQISMLMELAQSDLRVILKNRNESVHKLNIDFVRYWGGQVLRAVSAVHRHNIVHADLKPANFLVVDGSLKICDFGIANRVPDSTSSIHRQMAIGTLTYMAPETLQIPNEGTVYKVTKSSDLWSCGIILYEMVYQKYPFNTESNAVLMAQLAEAEVEHPRVAPGNTPVPLALHEVIRDCLERDPQKRPTVDKALESMFFSPVAADLQALGSIARSLFRYGLHVGKTDGEPNWAKVDECIYRAYEKLKYINEGKQHVKP